MKEPIVRFVCKFFLGGQAVSRNEFDKTLADLKQLYATDKKRLCRLLEEKEHDLRYALTRNRGKSDELNELKQRVKNITEWIKDNHAVDINLIRTKPAKRLNVLKPTMIPVAYWTQLKSITPEYELLSVCLRYRLDFLVAPNSESIAKEIIESGMDRLQVTINQELYNET